MISAEAKKPPIQAAFSFFWRGRTAFSTPTLVAPEGTVLKPNSAESCPAVFAVVTLQHGHV